MASICAPSLRGTRCEMDSEAAVAPRVIGRFRSRALPPGAIYLHVEPLVPGADCQRAWVFYYGTGTWPATFVRYGLPSTRLVGACAWWPGQVLWKGERRLK